MPSVLERQRLAGHRLDMFEHLRTLADQRRHSGAGTRHQVDLTPRVQVQRLQARRAQVAGQHERSVQEGDPLRRVRELLPCAAPSASGPRPRRRLRQVRRTVTYEPGVLRDGLRLAVDRDADACGGPAGMADAERQFLRDWPLRNRSRVVSSSGNRVSCRTTSPFSFQCSSAAMNRFTYSASSPCEKIVSPYLAWFSMPVPTQHQNELSSVE